MKIHNIATSKFIIQHVDQLKDDLKKENLKRKKLPNNWRDTLGWHRGLEGATKDKISQRSRQLPSNNKKKMAEVAIKFKIDLGIGYTKRSKSGWAETINKYSKQLTQKTIQDKIRATYGKLINSTSNNNKTPKKNKPEEIIILKCKRSTLIQIISFIF